MFVFRNFCHRDHSARYKEIPADPRHGFGIMCCQHACYDLGNWFAKTSSFVKVSSYKVCPSHGRNVQVSTTSFAMEICANSAVEEVPNTQQVSNACRLGLHLSKWLTSLKTTDIAVPVPQLLDSRTLAECEECTGRSQKTNPGCESV